MIKPRIKRDSIAKHETSSCEFTPTQKKVPANNSAIWNFGRCEQPSTVKLATMMAQTQLSVVRDLISMDLIGHGAKKSSKLECALLFISEHFELNFQSNQDSAKVSANCIGLYCF